jgi:hypothetical protein
MPDLLASFVAMHPGAAELLNWIAAALVIWKAH